MIDTMKKKRCVDDDDEDLPVALVFPKEGYLIQILIWLPVESLLRFKFVCSSWRSLIESPYFIDLHTATTFNSSSSSKFGSFILHASVESCHPRRFNKIVENAVLMVSSSDESEWLSRSESGSGGSGGLWWSQLNPSWPPVDDDSDDDDDDDDHVVDEVKVQGSLGSNDDDDDDKLVLKLVNLGFPPCYEFRDYFHKDIVGSCNGLVCLYHEMHNQFTLWNPATRQFRNLPKNTSRSLPGTSLAGFCFDAETKDYKVVLIKIRRTKRYYGKWGPNIPSECLCRVHVYSLSTDSWRLLEGITCLPGYPFTDTHNQDKLLYLNGCFFFIAFFLFSTHQKCLPDNDRFMISFDLTKEIITPIQLPDHHREDKLYLRYLGDKIALFTAPHVYDNDSNIYTYKDFQAETDSYEDDVGVKAQIVPDGDTGICNDEGLKAETESDTDSMLSFNTMSSVSSDEMEFYRYENFNIWVLNEHCTSSSTSSMNKEYWKKLHSFQIELENLDDWNLPRGISNDGKFALLETKTTKEVDKRIKLYNLLDKKVKKNFLSCTEVMSDATAYKPSLVSIIGGNVAAPADLKQEIKSTGTMDGELSCIWKQHWKHLLQHYPMTLAAQSM